MCYVLWCIQTPIPGNQCIWCQPWRGDYCWKEEICIVGMKVPDNAEMHHTAFVSKSLSSSKWQYSNIEWEALGIWHDLKKFQHYCFVKEECLITDHKPMVVMVNNDVGTNTLSVVTVHFAVHSPVLNAYLNKPGLGLNIADWLSWNYHTENKDQEIAGMNLNIHAINTEVDTLIFTSIENTLVVTSQDTYL